MNIFWSLFSSVGDPCKLQDTNFFGLPTWYHYLPGVFAYAPGNNAQNPGTPICSPSLGSLSDIWLIAAAIVEILLRLAALVAIVMVVYGGIEFITSQGEPEQANKARSTIINALIGLLIAVAAATLVTFIAGRFNS